MEGGGKKWCERKRLRFRRKEEMEEEERLRSGIGFGKLFRVI